MANQGGMGSRAFKGTLNYDSLRVDHQGQLKKLNDVLVETALAVEGLISVHDDVVERIAQGDTAYHLVVPNKRAKLIPIRRNLQSLAAKLENDISSTQYVKSIVFIVTILEDYLSTNLIRVLRAYPRKLLIPVKGTPGGAATYAVEMRDLLEAGSLGAIVRQRAEQRTRDAMYASPAQYIGYFSAVTGVQIKSTVWETYAEIKATRDLYVHSDGTVNDIYIAKTGSRARHTKGQKAVVDAAYFDSAASCLKHLMSEIYVGLRGTFSNSMELRRIFDEDAR